MNGILIGQSSGGGAIDSEGTFQTQRINAAEDILLAGESIKNLYAKKNHSSTSTEFGIGSGSNYGHVKVIDDLTSSGTAGVALSPKQGKILNEKITSLQDIIKILNTYGKGKDCYLDYGWDITDLSCVPVTTSEDNYHLTGTLNDFWFHFREVGDNNVDDPPFLEIIFAQDRQIDITYNGVDNGTGDPFYFEDGAGLYAACSLVHSSISHFTVASQSTPEKNLMNMSIEEIINGITNDTELGFYYIPLCFSKDVRPTIWPKTEHYHYADTSKTGYVDMSGTPVQTLQEKIADLENRIVALEASN